MRGVCWGCVGKGGVRGVLGVCWEGGVKGTCWHIDRIWGQRSKQGAAELGLGGGCGLTHRVRCLRQEHAAGRQSCME